LTGMRRVGDRDPRPGTAVHDATADDARRQRMYALLDTLVAVRMDLSRALGGGVAAGPAAATKLKEIRALLDGAIVATKTLIGEIDKTTTPPQD